ncbi:MAG TPA: alpha-2-macroglobulin family protein, partial [Armatimonadota bacterium]|nr:alpha-2-macroglobulin family protein [Armatimonadota bacterium]
SAAPGQEGIILRSDKSLARVGESLNLFALSSVKSGTLYLDVTRNQQTILTLAAPMRRGEARLRLPLTNDMAGTLELHAYTILPNEDIIRDSRVVVVSPADDLNVSVTADSKEYRPGGDAVLQFTVQDQQHHPVAAALGLAIVDESVFALSELKPGLAQVYFTLEKELMTPKYEIHGLGPAELLHPIVKRGSASADSDRQRAAAMIFAEAPAAGDFSLNVNSYQQRWEKVRGEAIKEMTAARNKIADAAQRYRNDTGAPLTAAQGLETLIQRGYLKESDVLDPWNHPYRVELHGAKDYSIYFLLSSAGPDGRWDTVDDLKDIAGFAWFGGPGGIRFRPGVAGGFGGGGFPGGGGGAGGLMMDRAAAGRVPLLGALPAETGAAQAVLAPRYAAYEGNAERQGGGEAPVRVREFFPETMYWNPSLLTDDHGRAQLHIPMADSITTWRLTMMANSAQGQLGSADAPIKVFQDFFVDIDLPVALTQHDRVDIPVAVYNYLPEAQKVTLSMEQGAWFTLRGPSVQTIPMGANEVKVVYYPITVNSIGRFPILVTARGARLSDAIRRTIQVLPDGKELRTVINDTLDGKAEASVTFPADAVKGASNIWVKLYPGAFSQVVEGLDGILRMPSGCFEQTSSSTYPDVLVLSYLKANKRINPELQLKAEQYINIGYQRLVTFECKNGGFSWFGDEPANQILTAYGLLEFSDMAKVHDVDPALIHRTQAWLANLQKPDGSWEETGHGIAEGIINRQTGALRTTAYVAWALAESGYQGPQLGLALQYVRAHRNEAHDAYTLAVILNLLAAVDRNGADTAQIANDLIGMAKTNDKTAYWKSDTETFTGGVGRGADLETTGLAAYGLVKWGRNSTFTNKVLTYLVKSRDSFGTWESTQGTVWSMKALLAASGGGSGGGKGTVTVMANGQKAATFAITPDNSDVMRQVNLGNELRPGRNDITLQYVGDGSLLYQVVGSYYLPWSKVEPVTPEGAGPLTLSVAYDKTTLAHDETATVTVTIKNNTRRVVEMPLIDLGVPPGFTVLPDRLDQAVAAKTISKYTIAARQIIVYMQRLAPDQTVTLTYQLKARFPIKARTPLSRAYPYYNPEAVTVSAPQEIVAG